MNQMDRNKLYFTPFILQVKTNLDTKSPFSLCAIVTQSMVAADLLAIHSCTLLAISSPSSQVKVIFPKPVFIKLLLQATTCIEMPGFLLQEYIISSKPEQSSAAIPITAQYIVLNGFLLSHL